MQVVDNSPSVRLGVAAQIPAYFLRVIYSTLHLSTLELSPVKRKKLIETHKLEILELTNRILKLLRYFTKFTQNVNVAVAIL